MQEGISLQKDTNRWRRGVLMVCMFAKEKNSEIFLVAYFHLRVSIT